MNQSDYIYIFQKIVEEARKEGRSLLTPADVEKHGIAGKFSKDVFSTGNAFADEIRFFEERENGWYAELKPKNQ